MILSFWKYLSGYVIIRIRGYSPERFINLCANKNIYMWNIKKTPDGYICSMSVKAFFMLASIAHKTRCRVKIIKKVGLPFKMQKIMKRRMFLFGLILSIFIMLALSLFVWRIEIEGNLEYTNEAIIDFLADNNIRVGSIKFKLNCSEIDNLLLDHSKKTIWVSSELKGTKLFIHIREGVEPEISPAENRPCDLVATVDGTIISIITRRGTPMVKAGDEVKSGDILVSGTLEIKELTQLKAIDFTSSDADIMIKKDHPYEDKEAYKYDSKEYLQKEKKKDRILQVSNTKINFIKPKLENDSFDEIKKQNQLEILPDFYLPIYLIEIEYLPYQVVEKEYSPQEAKEILEQRLSLYAKKLEENNIQILSNDVIFKEEADAMKGSGSLLIIKKDGKRIFFDKEIRRQEYNEYFTEDS